MVSNDIVVPLVLQRREALITGRDDVGALLLTVRRIAIFVDPAASPICTTARPATRSSPRSACLSFAAMAQLAPAFFGGLIWRRGHRARRDRRHDGRHPGLGLYAAAAELRRRRHRRARHPHARDRSEPRPAAAAGAARARSAAAGRTAWSGACRSTSSPMWRSRSRARRRRSSACRPTCSCPSDLAPMTPSFRLWRSSVTVEELTATVARYLGEERTRTSLRQLRGDAAASASSPRREADFQLLRYAEHLLASAIGAASSRLVLSLLLRKRTVSTKAALQAARRRQCGDPVQPRNPADRARPRAPGHRGVRQGPAARLLEPAVRRDPRPAAGAHPRRHRPRRDPALQRRAAARSGPASRRARARAARALRLEQRAVPRALRRARPGHRGARQPHAGRRHRHDLHRHHAERRGGRGAGARQRNAGAPRAASAPRS